MDRSRLATVVWSFVVSGIVVASLAGAGIGPATGQTPQKAYYYGKAVSDAGENLPPGTEIRAIVEEDGTNRTLDSVTIETAGQYGGAGLGEPKLGVPTDLDEQVYFVAVNGNGRFVANWSVANPEPGTKRQDLAFPPGSAEPRPYFQVSDLGPGDETVVEGETLAVNATIANDGSEPGSQTVSLEAGERTVATRDVTLEEGASTTVEFPLDTASLGPGNYTYGVETDDTSQTAALSVEPRRAAFAVSGLDPADATVVEGEVLNVSATVTNDGNARGTQTVGYRVDNSTVVSEDVTLNATETTTVRFAGIDTAQFGPGTYTHGVYTDDDSQTGTLTVRAERANFTVTAIDPADATVTDGNEFAISATITNEGTVQGTRTVAFRVNATTVGEQEVTLGSGATKTVAFAATNTSRYGPGSYRYGAYAANDSRTGTLVVESETPADFAISDLQPAETAVDRGTPITVTASVTNDGDAAATQQVQLRIGGDVVDRTAVTLASGRQTTVEFAGVETGAFPPGAYTHGVYANNDSQTGTLTIEGEGSATFTVANLTPRETTVTGGEFLDISALVTNQGETETTRRVRLRLDGDVVDSHTVTLGSGNQTTVSFDGIPAPADPGAHTYSVVTGTDSQSGTLTVGETGPTTPTATPATGTQTDETTTGTADGSGGGGLVPELVKMVLFYLGVLVAAVYLVLKALAIYLGY